MEIIVPIKSKIQRIRYNSTHRYSNDEQAHLVIRLYLIIIT